MVRPHELNKRTWARVFAKVSREVTSLSEDLIDMSHFGKPELVSNLCIFNTQGQGELCQETLRMMYTNVIRREVEEQKLTDSVVDDEMSFEFDRKTQDNNFHSLGIYEEANMIHPISNAMCDKEELAFLER